MFRATVAVATVINGVGKITDYGHGMYKTHFLRSGVQKLSDVKTVQYILVNFKYQIKEDQHVRWERGIFQNIINQKYIYFPNSIMLVVLVSIYLFIYLFMNTCEEIVIHSCKYSGSLPHTI